VTIAKGTLLEVKDSTGEWVLARVEFRIERGEPLGSYSFYREGGGGRIVQCLCKTREPKNRGDAVKWGVWCVEDRRFCDKTIGTEKHARAELPRWQSGKAAALQPDHGFHYEVCVVKWTASGPEPLLLSEEHHG